MSKMRFLLLCFFVLPFWASHLTSCETFKEFLGFGYKRPEVNLRNIEIAGITATEIKLLVSLEVRNPNSFQLKLNKVSYDLSASKLEIAHGSYDKVFQIEAESRSTISLPVFVNTKNMAALMGQIFDKSSGAIIALIKGTAYFDSPIGEIKHEFEQEKEIKQ